jgi:myo-inositol-1(or 4)-monophosphatase
MKLTNEDLERLCVLAKKAARDAGVYIRSRAGEHGEARTKESGDTPASQIVTEVDLESQRIILDVLRDSISDYDLGLLTEESVDDSSRLHSDFFWCIDPLDGTLSFVEGKPGYSVSIALVSREGKAVVGVIYDPTNQVTYHVMKGCGAFKDGELIGPSTSGNAEPLYWLMDRSMKSVPEYPIVEKAVQRIAEQAGLSEVILIDYVGAALNASWVTQHSNAIYFKLPKPSEGGGSFWDFAASSCLLEEWGQPATDIFGNPLDLNRAGSTFMNEKGVVYASQTKLAEALQQLCRQNLR